MDGRVSVNSPDGIRRLVPGDVMILGSKTPFEAHSETKARVWTVVVEEDFLLRYTSWAFPSPATVRPELRLDRWDGREILLHLGTETQARLEPLFRRMSVLVYRRDPTAVATALALFARTVALTAPHIVTHPGSLLPPPTAETLGEVGSLPLSREVERAAELMRSDLARRWTVAEIGNEVSLSSSQLTRRFTREFGLTPIRWLAEARATEFARLIEETALGVDAAAKQVGWNGRGPAWIRFRGRYGLPPRQYRIGR